MSFTNWTYCYAIEILTIQGAQKGRNSRFQSYISKEMKQEKIYIYVHSKGYSFSFLTVDNFLHLRK